MTEWSNVGIAGSPMEQQGILDMLEKPSSASNSPDFCVSELQCQRGGLGLPRTDPRSEFLIGYAAERSLRLLNRVNFRTCIRWQKNWVVDIYRDSTWTARLFEGWRLTEDAHR